MKKYAVIFEKSSNGWGAFVPDLPGCVALDLAAMRADGDEIPEPSYVEMVEVA